MRKLFLSMALLVPTATFADPCEAPLPSPGTRFSGSVRYVGDGDSICVGNSGNSSTWIEVRVADFYAPELHSAGGPQAKAAMERIAMGRSLQCVAEKRSYDRVVAECTLNGTSIGDLMRREGVAEGGRGR
jgi:micrococcal nuclease